MRVSRYFFSICLKTIPFVVTGIVASIPLVSEAAVPHVPVSVTSSTVVTPKYALNTATEKELAMIPGVTPAKARSIVSFRKKNGPFANVDVLKKVAGFKRMDAQKFKEITTHLTL